MSLSERALIVWRRPHVLASFRGEGFAYTMVCLKLMDMPTPLVWRLSASGVILRHNITEFIH